MHDRLPESMTHDDLLLALLYDELSPGQAAAAREKLAAEAPESLERLAEWRSIRDVVAELPELEPDPQIHYDIIREARRAADEAEKPSRLWAWLQELTLMPALAGLLLVVLAAGLTLRLSSDFEESGAEALPDLAAEPQPAATKKAAPEKRAATASKDAPVPTAESPAPRGGEPSPPTEAPGETSATLDPDAPADDVAAARETDGREAAEDEGRGGSADGEDSMADARSSAAYGAEAEKGAGAARRAAPPKVEARLDLEAQAPTRAKAKAEEAVVEDAKAVEEERAPSKRKASIGKKLRRKAPPPEAKPSKRQPRERDARAAGGKAGMIDDLFGDAPADSAPAPRREPTPAPDDRAVGTATRAAAPPAGPSPQAAARPEADKQATLTELGAVQAEQDADGAQRKYAPPPPVTPSPDPAPAEPAPEPAGAQPPAPTRAAQTAGAVRVDEDAAEARAEVVGGDVALADARDGDDEDRLSRARLLRDRGLYREAVGEYEAFLSENRGQSGLDRVWFEAAESYRALGQIDRAMQLYRLVAGGDSGYAQRARDRIANLTATQADQAKDVPQAAPAKARQQAEPVFDEVEAVERK